GSLAERHLDKIAWLQVEAHRPAIVIDPARRPADRQRQHNPHSRHVIRTRRVIQFCAGYRHRIFGIGHVGGSTEPVTPTSSSAPNRREILASWTTTRLCAGRRRHHDPPIRRQPGRSPAETVEKRLVLAGPATLKGRVMNWRFAPAWARLDLD